MSNSINVVCLMKSVQLLLQGVKELGLAVNDLREANSELQMLQNCQGEKVKIDYLIKNEVGDKIGVRANSEGNVELIVQNDKSPTVKATVDKVTQAYARLKILDEVKRKGYKSVKEEKLANGSIRLVVEKMAIKKELIIEIAPDGSLNIKTEGFKGAECEEELKPIEKALGNVTERIRTSDFYKQSENQKRKISSSTE